MFQLSGFYYMHNKCNNSPFLDGDNVQARRVPSIVGVQLPDVLALSEKQRFRILRPTVCSKLVDDTHIKTKTLDVLLELLQHNHLIISSFSQFKLMLR